MTDTHYVPSKPGDLKRPTAVSPPPPPVTSERTLRDEFAMEAMKPILKWGLCNRIENVFQKSANASYKMADAMMKAREES